MGDRVGRRARGAGSAQVVRSVSTPSWKAIAASSSATWPVLLGLQAPARVGVAPELGVHARTSNRDLERRRERVRLAERLASRVVPAGSGERSPSGASNAARVTGSSPSSRSAASYQRAAVAGAVRTTVAAASRSSAIAAGSPARPQRSTW